MCWSCLRLCCLFKGLMRFAIFPYRQIYDFLIWNLACPSILNFLWKTNKRKWNFIFAGDGRGRKILNTLKTQYLMNTLYLSRSSSGGVVVGQLLNANHPNQEGGIQRYRPSRNGAFILLSSCIITFCRIRLIALAFSYLHTSFTDQKVHSDFCCPFRWLSMCK